MKRKPYFLMILAMFALSQWTSTANAQKNYYQFGLGFWVFEPLYTQAYAMSYEHSIKSRFAIGGVFTYQIEEYTHYWGGTPANMPFHDYVHGFEFSHPQLLTDNITEPGLIYFTGTLYRDEETFGGLYVSYELFKKRRASADIALGCGVMTENFRCLSEERVTGISIDSDTIYGWTRTPYYLREIGFAGFFRAGFNYRLYGNLYIGGSLLLPYIYAYGFPLKLTLNIGVKF